MIQKFLLSLPPGDDLWGRNMNLFSIKTIITEDAYWSKFNLFLAYFLLKIALCSLRAVSAYLTQQLLNAWINLYETWYVYHGILECYVAF
jgi:hypothetical protein